MNLRSVRAFAVSLDMGIISYAPNFEDVMLSRALAHVERGFYIDIGAQDPVVDSISLCFYERGWRGIHVEPAADYAKQIREQRPADVVIQSAVGNGASVTVFFETPGTGLSTTPSNIAADYFERGMDARETRVPCIPLSSVFEIVARGLEVHWLKVDVEGSEESDRRARDRLHAYELRREALKFERLQTEANEPLQRFDEERDRWHDVALLATNTRRELDELKQSWLWRFLVKHVRKNRSQRSIDT